MALPELGKLEYYILTTCHHCKGTGEVLEYPVNSGGGTPTGTTTCPECDGEGKLVSAEIWSVD